MDLFSDFIMLLICDYHSFNLVGHRALNLTLTDNPCFTLGELIKRADTNPQRLAPSVLLTAGQIYSSPAKTEETKADVMVRISILHFLYISTCTMGP